MKNLIENNPDEIKIHSSIYTSVKRGLFRMFILSVIGIINLLISFLPELIGLVGGIMPVLAPVCYGFGLVFLGLSVGDLALRILQPKIDSQQVALQAMRENDIGSGLVYLGRCILAAIVLLLVVTASRAEEPPTAALPYLFTLKIEQLQWWDTHPLPSTLGAQIEQETCISLKHRMCWNPRAELHTKREQGIGFGQLTRTWNSNGVQRFDAMAEIVDKFPSQLKGLSWKDPYDPILQLRALILKDLFNYKMILDTNTPSDRLAMSFSAYNGGLGGLSSDRRACAATSGCNSGKWFKNVENTSLKAKAAVPGYGKSFFMINREYVTNVMINRRIRYLGLEG